MTQMRGNGGRKKWTGWRVIKEVELKAHKTSVFLGKEALLEADPSGFQSLMPSRGSKAIYHS